MDKKKKVAFLCLILFFLGLTRGLESIFPPAHDGMSGAIRTAEILLIALFAQAVVAWVLRRYFKVFD